MAIEERINLGTAIEPLLGSELMRNQTNSESVVPLTVSQKFKVIAGRTLAQVFHNDRQPEYSRYILWNSKHLYSILNLKSMSQ